MRLPPLSLPRGVWLILGFLAGAWLASAGAGPIGGPPIPMWLALIPPSVWSGEAWRLFTYALLPAGLLDLLLSGFMIAWIGSRVARVWSTAEFLTYCGICAAGAAIAVCLVLPSADFGIVTPSVIVAGLLVAWARLFGHERVWLTPTYQTSRYAIALFILAAMLLILVLGCGRILAIPFISAALTGWAYLTLRWRANRAQPPRSLKNERVSRLEL